MIDPSREMSVIEDCIDGQGHVWGESKEMIDRQGRRWISQGCKKCNVGSMQLVDDPARSMEAFRDLLAVDEEYRE